MRGIGLLGGCAAALAFSACTSEQTTTEPPAGASLARGGGAYTAVDLGMVSATSINASGQVVGGNFIWEKGVFTDLGSLVGSSLPGCVPSFPVGCRAAATDINAAGQVVGSSAVPGGRCCHAFLWKKGVMTDLGVLGETTFQGTLINSSRANAINSAGQVVGVSTTNVFRQTHAFLWQNGAMIDLGTLGGGFSEATDINPKGQVVGWSLTATGEERAFLWENGSMVDLGTLGGNSAVALSINPRGQVVGHSTRTGVDEIHAFLWEKGAMTDLGTLGGSFSEATGINPRGEVVGRSTTEEGNNIRAFIWKNGVMTDLGTIGGGCCANASAISPAGEVVGIGFPEFSHSTAVLWTRKTSR